MIAKLLFEPTSQPPKTVIAVLVNSGWPLDTLSSTQDDRSDVFAPTAAAPPCPAVAKTTVRTVRTFT
jgi:hypothetical protein